MGKLLLRAGALAIVFFAIAAGPAAGRADASCGLCTSSGGGTCTELSEYNGLCQSFCALPYAGACVMDSPEFGENGCPGIQVKILCYAES